MNLVTCCETGVLETFRRLITENPHSIKTYRSLCMDHTSKNGYIDIIRELLIQGVNPNSRNSNGETPYATLS
jgi:ankyrin repeat protein